MSVAEGLVIGAIYFVTFLSALLAAAALIQLIGPARVARWLHLPSGEDL